MSNYFWEDEDEIDICWIEGMPCIRLDEIDWLADKLRKAAKRMWDNQI